MSDAQYVPPGVDPTRPTAARLYDYYLGGTTNFAADRAVAERLKADVPDLIDAVWANRGFHGRAAVWLARRGIRQFIDIGSGLPTQNNTHEAVHKVAPEARVVYVDNDPMVAAHADALLAEDGTTAVITADLRDPGALLGHPSLLALIDLAEPAGVLITSVMHFVPDEMDPWGMVAQYMAAVAPNSYLVLSHGTYDNIGSSTGSSSCRPIRTLIPASPTRACGVPRIRWPQTATGRAGSIAASPGAPPRPPGDRREAR